MIALDNITIKQGNFELLHLNLQIPKSAYAVIMGPTGCGKTTILESVCGLRSPQGGKVFIDGEDVTNTETSQRGIGYVPQDSGLFPAMRVDKQIEFPLSVRKVPKRSRLERVRELANQFQIESLMNRYPDGLSGGEKQRVSLARALSYYPRVLCLDEPLSALDDATRSVLCDLLKQIQQNQETTVMHITHNKSEGLELGTHHFRFDKGKIVEVDLDNE